VIQVRGFAPNWNVGILEIPSFHHSIDEAYAQASKIPHIFIEL
jgi:hypothetical protein